MPNKVLIIVDMLNDFSKDGALPVPGFEAIVPNVVGRVNEYRKADLPVIFLGDSHAENDKEFDRFPKHCVRGTDGANVVASLEFSADRDVILHKTRYSGFYETGLGEVIRTLMPDVVELCGVCTSICVMDTVGGLANRDIPTVVHRNCVADLTKEDHAYALKRMKTIYGTEII